MIAVYYYRFIAWVKFNWMLLLIILKRNNMKFTPILLLLFVFASCNPCRQIAKHPECFSPDTIKIVDKQIKYVKEYITNDSIIFDTIPCDPKTNTVYDTKTVYRTNWKTSIDTIYTSKVVDRINPINEVLKQDNEKLDRTNKVKNKVLWFESILLLLIALIVYIKIKL